MKIKLKLSLLFLSFLFLSNQSLVAQWVRTNGPYSGEIFSIYSNDKVLIAGVTFGFQLSTDNGQNWRHTFSYSTVNSFTAIGQNIFYSTYYDILRSTDNGQNWTIVDTSISESQGRFASIGSNNGTLFAGTRYGGIYFSTNNGSSWKQSSLTSQVARSFTGIGTTVYAGTDSGVYRSVNNGLTWVKAGLFNYRINIVIMKGTKLFAGTNSDGIYCSTDNGSNWFSVNSGLSDSTIYSLTVNDSYIFLGTLKGVFRSDNDGYSWTRINVDYSTPVSTIFAHGSKLYIGTLGNGLFVSSNKGDSWVQIGLTPSVIQSLCVNGNTLFTETGNEVFRTKKNGIDWEKLQVNSSFTPYINSMFTVDSAVYLGTGHGCYVTKDNGNTWNYVFESLKRIESIKKKGNYLFAGGLQGILRSSDEGVHWLLLDSLHNYLGISNLVINGENIIVSDSRGIYRSTDNGENWDEITSGIIGTSVRFLLEAGDDIFAGTSSYGVYRLLQDKRTWMQTSLRNEEISSLSVKGNIVFAGTQNGEIYFTTDRGSSWEQIHDKVTDFGLWSIACMNHYIYVSTGANIYRRPLSELIPMEPSPFISLIQNYPNPFNPTTNIGFNLPIASHVDLKIFDLLGREVTTLISEYLPEGIYATQWDAANVSAGVYYYQLKVGSKVQTKSMILLK